MALPYYVYHTELEDARITYASDSSQFGRSNQNGGAQYEYSAQHDDNCNSDEEPQPPLEADYDSYVPQDDPANHIWTGSNKSKAALIFPQPEPIGPLQPGTSPPVMLPTSSTQPPINVSNTAPTVETETRHQTPAPHRDLRYTGAQFHTYEGPQYSAQLSLTEGPVPEETVCCCELCDVKFHGEYAKRNLARHVQMRHVEREGALKCPEDGCGKQFRRTDALLLHKRREHGHVPLPVLRRQV